jgi:DNA-binding GntR family transcriptional regulator
MLEEMIDLMAEQAAADDISAFFGTNTAFHEALVEASGNRKLSENYRQLARQLGRYRMRSLALRGNLQRSIAEHRQLLSAVRAKEIDRAVELASEHIHVPLRRLESASPEELVELGLAEPEAFKEARV